MPIISSKYNPIIKNAHIHTMMPSLFRKVKFMEPRQVEIETIDNDFLELDMYEQSSNSIVIISHGLEGNSKRAYVRGMARHFYENKFDCLCWNFRSCGSKMNRNLKLYNSGNTQDIAEIIQYVVSLDKYNEIHLVGFSMGGNITLKYLGEQADNVFSIIKSAVAISVPVDLAGSSIELMSSSNQIYMSRFIRKLGRKMKIKSEQYPEQVSMDGYENIKTFKDFDDRYTAPIFGFENAEDYWNQSGSISYLDKIKIPTLILNAQDDTFLSKSCFPYQIAQDSKFIHLETPISGGHVGFWSLRKNYYSEIRAVEFCINA